MAFAESCGRDNIAESLAAEVLPVADACDFLIRSAGRLLKAKKLGSRGRPMWMLGVRSEIRRDPWGVVLIVAPSNYPLMLPGIQLLQALVAGNAVAVKPAPGCSEPMLLLRQRSLDAGLPPNLFVVLPEGIDAVDAALDAGIHKVVLTGSVHTGRTIQQKLSERLVPSAMELSGCDAVYVDRDADIPLAAKCLAFSLHLNAGQTCLAARRIFVHHSVEERLTDELQRELSQRIDHFPADRVPDSVASTTAALVKAALESGASLLVDGLEQSDGAVYVRTPTVLRNAVPSMQLLQEDVFAPVLSLVTVPSVEGAIEAANQCPYALAATVFSRSQQTIDQLSESLNVGCVVANDMVVPTADPRIPFGGRRRSGFGVTRGAEGLLQMTQPKTVIQRRNRWLPHLDSPTPFDAGVLQNLIVVSHGNPLQKLKASMALTRLSMAQRKYRKQAHDSDRESTGRPPRDV